MQNQVYFANRAQVTLYECELKGQISDGHWENSRPHDHWSRMCNAEAVVSVDKLGTNFVPLRKYNFANKMLVSVVGSRMIAYVKLYSRFRHLKFSDHWDLPESEDLAVVNQWAYNVFNPMQYPNDYYVKKGAKIREMFPSAMTHQELSNLIMNAFHDEQYTKKDLKKDLKEMSAAVNS